VLALSPWGWRIQEATLLCGWRQQPKERAKTAVGCWYEGTGHMPFIENAERFNRELAAFADRATE
jgi:pimeloyl-ACP methyl ester carboxylesterase